MKRLLTATLMLLASSPLVGEDFDLAALGQLQQGKFAVDPEREIVFPVVANGVSGPVGIRTSMVITNPREEDVTVSVRISTSAGGSMGVQLYDSTTLSPVGNTLTIAGFESIFLETDGRGSLRVGWAKVVTSGSTEFIGGVAAYQVFDSSNPDLIHTIVGVGASSASPAFFTPVFRATHLKTNTAVALANNSTETVYLRAVLVGNPGFESMTEYFRLGPRQQASNYLQELFPSVGDIYFGTLYFLQTDSSGELAPAFDVHAIALLESVGILSSLPVTHLVPSN